MIPSVYFDQKLWTDLSPYWPVEDFFVFLEAKFMWIDISLSELVIHVIALKSENELGFWKKAKDSHLTKDRKRFQVSVYFIGKDELKTDFMEDRIKAEVKRLMIERKVAKESDFPDWYYDRWWKGSITAK